MITVKYLRFSIGVLILICCGLLACQPKESRVSNNTSTDILASKGQENSAISQTVNLVDTVDFEPIVKSEAEWRKELTEEEFRVLRQKGTEYAFSGKYWDNKEKGIYICAACQLPLFDSETKFKSGTGWPSYCQAIKESYITEYRDNSAGMLRTEVTCGRCDGHLGHVFNDGPKPTGLRYCINSVSLDFKKVK